MATSTGSSMKKKAPAKSARGPGHTSKQHGADRSKRAGTPASATPKIKHANGHARPAAKAQPRACPQVVLDDLARSGLKPNEIDWEFIPKGSPDSLFRDEDAIRFRYRDVDGNMTDFYRDRMVRRTTSWDALKVAPAAGAKKKPKYLQPPGTPPRLYFYPYSRGLLREALADPAITIIFVEGEKKAAALALAYPDAIIIGLGGVNSWHCKRDETGRRYVEGVPLPELELINCKNRRICILFDTDLSETAYNRVKKAREALAYFLHMRGARVYDAWLEDPDKGSGKDKMAVDDFLVEHGRKKGGEAIGCLLDELEPWELTEEQRVVHQLNERYAIVSSGGDVCILDEQLDDDGQLDFVLRQPRAMELLFKNKTIFVASDDPESKKKGAVRTHYAVWVSDRNRREYERIVFDPTGEAPENLYNMWQGYAVEPIEGAFPLFTEVMLTVICDGNQEHFEWLLKWLAFLVQHPGVVPQTAVVLQSEEEGTGKSVFATYVGSLYGRHFMHLSDPESLTGKHNAHLRYAKLIFADEAFWAGDKSVRGKLFAMISEKTRMVEPKFVDKYKVKNLSALIISSNHDQVVPAGPSARRFAVLKVSAKRLKDYAFYAAVEKERVNGGASALLYHLMHKVDLTGFNPREAPVTKGLIEQKAYSLSGVARFWLDYLRRHTASTWKEWVPRSVLQMAYVTAMGDTGETRRSLQTEMGMNLRRLVPHLDREGKRKRPTVTKAWDAAWGAKSAKDQESETPDRFNVYYLGTLAECRSAMAAYLRTTVDELFGDAPGEGKSS